MSPRPILREKYVSTKPSTTTTGSGTSATISHESISNPTTVDMRKKNDLIITLENDYKNLLIVNQDQHPSDEVEGDPNNMPSTNHNLMWLCSISSLPLCSCVLVLPPPPYINPTFIYDEAHPYDHDVHMVMPRLRWVQRLSWRLRTQNQKLKCVVVMLMKCNAAYSTFTFTPFRSPRSPREENKDELHS